MKRDNVEAPWIGNDDYGKHNTVSQEDYDWHWQDDRRKEQQEETFEDE